MSPKFKPHIEHTYTETLTALLIRVEKLNFNLCQKVKGITMCVRLSISFGDKFFQASKLHLSGLDLKAVLSALSHDHTS